MKEGEVGKGKEEAESGERAGKWEAGLDLDICPEPPEFLVTPLCFAGGGLGLCSSIVGLLQYYCTASLLYSSLNSDSDL